jgi:hypothetical protein
MTTDRPRIVTYAHHPKRWLAVVHGRFGYVLDLYPEERDHLRELGCAVVGEFTIRQDAIDAAAAALTSLGPCAGTGQQRLVDVLRIA